MPTIDSNINNTDLAAAIEANGIPLKLINTGRSIKIVGEPSEPESTITIGSMGFAGGAIPTVGVSINGGALISGGDAGYTIGTITGTPPTGLTTGIIDFAGSWYFTLTGTPTTFGSYSFTVTVLDANLLESAPKEFTVEVIS